MIYKRKYRKHCDIKGNINNNSHTLLIKYVYNKYLRNKNK